MAMFTLGVTSNLATTGQFAMWTHENVLLLTAIHLLGQAQSIFWTESENSFKLHTVKKYHCTRLCMPMIHLRDHMDTGAFHHVLPFILYNGVAMYVALS